MINKPKLKTQDQEQNQFLLPLTMPYQMNTQQIMQTIFNTQQLIKRTKLYVQNIPIKTQFYQSCTCQNNINHYLSTNKLYQSTNNPYQPTNNPCQSINKPYQSINKPYQSISKSYQYTNKPYQSINKQYQSTKKQYQQQKKYNTCNNYKNLQQESTHPYSYQSNYSQAQSPVKFNKSLTPVQKLSDIQFQYEYQKMDYQSQKNNQTQKNYKSQRNYQSQKKPYKYQYYDYNSHTQQKQLTEIQQIDEPLLLDQYNYLKNHNIQTFRPITKLKENQQIKLLEIESSNINNRQNYDRNKLGQKINTSNKSPLNKTFQAYSTYSSKPSSTRSKQQSINNQINKNNQKQQINNDNKNSNNNRYDPQYNNIGADEVIRYFKKKQKVAQGVRFSFRDDDFRQKRRQRQKNIQQILQFHQQKFKDKTLINNSQKQKEDNEKQQANNNYNYNNVEKISSQFITPFAISPRDYQSNKLTIDIRNINNNNKNNKNNNNNNNNNITNNNNQNFTRQCCTPFSKTYYKTQNNLFINQPNHKSPKHKSAINQSSKQKQTKQKSISNKQYNYQIVTSQPVYPFQTIQQQYNLKTNPSKSISKSKSPTNQYINKNIKSSPLNQQNIKNKLQEKNKQQNISSINKLKSQDKRDTIKKTHSNYLNVRKNSPQIKEYHSIQINMHNLFDTQNQQQQQNIMKSQHIVNKELKKQNISNKKRPGIRVMLNNSSPNTMKIQSIWCQIPASKVQQTNIYNQQKISSSFNQQYIQISIKQNESLQKQNNKRQKNSNQQPSKHILNNKTFHQKQYKHQKTPTSKISNKLSLADKIAQQLSKLQNLNRIDNQINLRQSSKSKQRQNKTQNKQQKQLLKSSKKFQRKNSNSKKKDDSFIVQNQKSKIHQNIFTKSQSQSHPISQIKRSTDNLGPLQKLQINQINSLTIYPSSLQKYKSTHQSQKQSYADILNNTISFTPQKQKHHRFQVPKSHIIRLQKSMEALNQYSLQKQSLTSKRKKIFDEKSNSKSKYNSPDKNIIDKRRVKKLYQKDILNHNKSMQSKLYNFLVQQDSSSKRVSEKKNKFSPSNRNKKSAKQRWGRLFQTEMKKQQSGSSRKNSPRLSCKGLFKYKAANQLQKDLFHRSVSGFQQSLRGDSIDRNSVQSRKEQSIQKIGKSQMSIQKLNELQIRKQIKRIKQYEFIERYMTNYELQRLLRNYIHRCIPTRKWSLLVIDQVYKRIRDQKEKGR